MALQLFVALALATAQGRPLPDAQGEFLAQYDFPADEFEWTVSDEPSSRRCRVWRVEFPSPVDSPEDANDTVVGYYHRPEGDGPFPALVILHWLGGGVETLRFFCTGLATRGVASLMIYMPYYGPRGDGTDREMLTLDVDATVEGFAQAVCDTRRAMHWLRSRGEVGSVGVMGVSLGSLVAATASGVDSEFEQTILVIGGGDLASILTTESRETADARAEMERRGLTEEGIREAVRRIEPLTFADRIDGSRVLMINATEDEVILRRNTELLADAIGEGVRREWLEGGHTSVAAAMPRVQDWVVEFVADDE